MPRQFVEVIAQAGMKTPQAQAAPNTATTTRKRRNFLRSTSVLIGAATTAGATDILSQTVTPQVLRSGALPIPESMKSPGAPIGAHLYGNPSSFEGKVIRNVLPNQPQYISSSSRKA
jgi:sulfane dehydrogenase subunit SoxC